MNNVDKPQPSSIFAVKKGRIQREKVDSPNTQTFFQKSVGHLPCPSKGAKSTTELKL